MTQPNQYTLKQGDDVFGLHKYPDGLFLVQQHKSGDWIVLRKATYDQVRVFEQKGTPAGRETK